MENDFTTIVRVAFTVLFFIVLFALIPIMRNYKALFGVDPRQPSETGSARSYHRLQVFVIWVHALLLTGAFALLLH